MIGANFTEGGIWANVIGRRWGRGDFDRARAWKSMENWLGIGLLSLEGMGGRGR